MRTCMHTYIPAKVCKVKGQLSGISSLLVNYVCPGDHTQIDRLDSKHLLRHLYCPSLVFKS